MFNLRNFNLRNKDVFREIAHFGEAGSRLVIRDRNDVPDVDLGIHGMFARLGEHEAALYRTVDVLMAWIDGKALALSDVTDVNCRTVQGVRELTVVDTSGDALAITYPMPAKPPTDDYIEDEDYDFGAWLLAIFRSPERQQVLREVWRVPAP